jgi:hypothetical protein
MISENQFGSIIYLVMLNNFGNIILGISVFTATLAILLFIHQHTNKVEYFVDASKRIIDDQGDVIIYGEIDNLDKKNLNVAGELSKASGLYTKGISSIGKSKDELAKVKAEQDTKLAALAKEIDPLAGLIKYENKACTNRSELGTTFPLVTGAGHCKQQCIDDPSCISFMHNPKTGECRRSTTCNSDNAQYDANLNLYFKKGATIPILSEFEKHSKKSCKPAGEPAIDPSNTNNLPSSADKPIDNNKIGNNNNGPGIDPGEVPDGNIEEFQSSNMKFHDLTPEQCAQECKKRNNCVSFEYNRDNKICQMSGSCIAKSIAPKTHNNASTDVYTKNGVHIVTVSPKCKSTTCPTYKPGTLKCPSCPAPPAPPNLDELLKKEQEKYNKPSPSPIDDLGNGLIRSVADSTQCVFFKGGSAKYGTDVVTRNCYRKDKPECRMNDDDHSSNPEKTDGCYPTNAHKFWYYGRDYQIKNSKINKDGVCLDIDINSNKINVHKCKDNNNKKWTYDSKTKQIKSHHGGMCLTFKSPGGDNKDGGQLYGSPCLTVKDDPTMTDYIKQKWDIIPGSKIDEFNPYINQTNIPKKVLPPVPIIPDNDPLFGIFNTPKYINAKVIFYKNKGWDGHKWAYSQNTSWIGGSANDEFSSMKTRPGYIVQVYEHDGYGGKARTVTPQRMSGYNVNSNNLKTSGFSDKISSFKIYSDHEFNEKYKDVDKFKTYLFEDTRNPPQVYYPGKDDKRIYKISELNN